MVAHSSRYSLTDFDALGPETCVIYLRISQDRTGQQLGVERQEKDCRALAKSMGLRVARVYRDNDISATKGKVRPEFEAMLKAHPEVIIAWHQDRLLRLTSDLEKVISLEVPVHMVTAGSLDLSTPAGRAVARTVAAWSQYEGEQKALRQHAANRQRAENGHWQFSRRPYGYERRDGRVEIVEAEAEIIREGYSRYVAGASYYEIANDWNDRGVPTFTGPWSMERVRQMFRNPRYAGIVEHKGTRFDVEPQWTPIIDERTWSDYISTRDGRKRAGSWSTSTKHLLSGLLRCAVCGGSMLARPDRGRQVYACTSNWCVSIGADETERFVEALVLGRLADRKVIAALRHAPDTAPLQDEMAALRKRREDITDLLADGILDRRSARAKATELTQRIDALSGRLAAMRRESPLTDLALARSVPSRWRKLRVLDRRRVIEEIGLRVTIEKGRPGRAKRDDQGRRLLDVRRVHTEWVDLDAEIETMTEIA
ncbi:recombinase family protein [Microbacterium sp. A204]|uniref:recombinase family protein n=1 Tax=Microbacterium sp. A204 TaxID=3457321 RepID=UPI003FD1F113